MRWPGIKQESRKQEEQQQKPEKEVVPRKL